jgi:hypothetical protein
MHVTGSGNFDRVDSPMLDHLDRWKTYPPKSSFKQNDPLGFKGEKTFEQPLIASQPGPQTLPGLSFSYFDPATRRYEAAHSTPLNVTISPSAAENSLGAPRTPAPGPGSTPASGTTATSAAGTAPGGLRPDHVITAEAGANSLMPLYLRPRFLALPSLLVLALTVGWLALRRRASDADTWGLARGRGASKAAARRLARVEAAAKARDTVQFFAAARSALQEAFGIRWNLAPDQVTAAEAAARLGDDQADIRELFALADEARYSGEHPSATDFARWIEIVRREVDGAKS